MGTRLHRRSQDDSGAALIEFALVLPLFMTIILGLFSGGQSYNQKLSITNGGREAARYGATLPVSTLDAWINSVGAVAIEASTRHLDAGVKGRSICVAFVYPGTLARPQTATKATRSKTVGVTGTFAAAPLSTAPCFTDSRPADEARVQVVVARKGRIELLFVPAFEPNLRSTSLMRFERA